MKDLSKRLTVTHHPRQLVTRARPCGQRCPHQPGAPGESTKHRRCLLAQGACAHSFFGAPKRL